MSLFRNSILDSYRNDPRIVSALKGITLLNSNEFNDYFAPNNRKSARALQQAINAGPEAESKLRLTRMESAVNKEAISKDVLEQLANTVCVDRKTGQPTIGEAYGRSAINRLGTNDFDILVAIEESDIPAGKTETVAKHKLSHVVGFVIAQLGECRKKIDIWSVNLICSKTLKRSGASVKGSILLGAFLYCIKNSNFKQEGILELAGGYETINGFISYTKMGFNKDLSLYGNNCFHDYNNLPMSCNISMINNETIINRAGERERRVVTPTEDDSGIYNAGKINPSIQNRLILCNDLLYRIQLDYVDISSDPRVLNDIELTQKFNALLASGANNENRMIQELTNEREQILREIVPGKNCIQECIDGVCKCLGWSGGKYKTRKLHNKSHHNKSHHNKSHHNKSHHNKSHHNKSHHNKSYGKKRRRNA
jgi:hypothetical protein